MTPEQFAYWFQGFAELSETPPTQEQWDSMRVHVATVFKKVTPSLNIEIRPQDGKTLKDCLEKFPMGRDFHPLPVITC
jgi:hypothetical protein